MYRSVHFMRKGEVTRERILSSAAELIHQRGMNVVSIGDVLNHSGTGKSQFYSHFQSRDDLIKAVLKLNEHRICDALSKPIESWSDLREWIYIHEKFQSKYGFERGCPFGTAAYSLQAGQVSERGPLRRVLDRMRQRVVSFLETQKSAGSIRTSANPEKLASFAVASIQGAMMIGVIERDGKNVGAVLDECYAHLESYRIRIRKD